MTNSTRLALVPAVLALALVALAGRAGAQGTKPASAPAPKEREAPEQPSWWPARSKLRWRYEGKLIVEATTKKILYEVATKDKETIGEREAFALEASAGPRVLSSEWYAFDDAGLVLLVRHKAGDEAARDLEPAQTFLDTSQLVDGGKWSWQSKDGLEDVKGNFVKNERLAGRDGREHACAVVETHLVARAPGGKTQHEQKRTLWLERGVGLVREVTTTTRPGAPVGEATRMEVDLVRVEARE